MSVSATDSRIAVYKGDEMIADSSAATIVDEDDDRTLGDKAGCAVWGVLSAIQDDISEHFTEPWPTYPGRRMALPGVREEYGRLFLWYGDNESEPLVHFPPIELNELESA